MRKAVGLLAELIETAGKPLLVVAALISAAIGAIWIFTGNLAVLALFLATVVIVFAHVDSQRKLRIEIDRQTFETYRQVESLASLYVSLGTASHPLPAFRRWSISPDFASLIVESIRERRPALIVELGSGSSTVISCMAARTQGGRVVSIEHEPTYASRTSNALKGAQLDGIGTVIVAPLRSLELRDGTWEWYDLTHLASIENIDLLVIDGPPIDLQPLSRYPALPQLFQQLSADARVLVDDGDDPDMKRCIDKWGEEFPGLSASYLALEKGAFVLAKRAP